MSGCSNHVSRPNMNQKTLAHKPAQRPCSGNPLQEPTWTRPFEAIIPPTWPQHHPKLPTIGTKWNQPRPKNQLRDRVLLNASYEPKRTPLFWGHDTLHMAATSSHIALLWPNMTQHRPKHRPRDRALIKRLKENPFFGFTIPQHSRTMLLNGPQQAT